MGNLSAILAHCGRGEEVILAIKPTLPVRSRGIAALEAYIPIRFQPNRWHAALDDIQAAIRPDDSHSRSRLVALENTQNRCGGVALTVEYTQAAGMLAHRHGLSLHLDGARIFNAAIAQGVEAADLAAPADSVTFCLSKALCAPVGSVLCGSKEFIDRAHRVRKQLGGGMRQAGVLAAAGIIALEKMRDRLAEDHARARRLAECLANLPDLVLDPGTPQTNMIFLSWQSMCMLKPPKWPLDSPNPACW
jgi:threonine aldolase